ncbi:hypothetical protein [Streptomyces sp. NPDC051561]|uniref:hypothetical protein n=1 Tax=Streptomyces sp. NPDC051561 TaxID=3365658 RepID=UPI00379467D8
MSASAGQAVLLAGAVALLLPGMLMLAGRHPGPLRAVRAHGRLLGAAGVVAYGSVLSSTLPRALNASAQSIQTGAYIGMVAVCVAIALMIASDLRAGIRPGSVRADSG